MKWRDSAGNLTNRFMPYDEWRKMTERAAAGAIDGGGALPKGFAESTVGKGGAVWSDLQGTANTGVKAKAWSELKSAAMWFTQDLKAAPLLTKLSAIAMSASAFDLGWKIGGGEGSFWSFVFGGADSEETPEPQSHDWQAYRYLPVGRAENLCSMVGTGISSGPCESGGEGLAVSQPGFVMEQKNGSGQKVTWVWPSIAGESEGCYEAENYAFQPEGYGYLEGGLVHNGSGCAGNGFQPFDYSKGVFWTAAIVKCVAGQTTEGCPEEKADVQQEGAPTTPLEGEDATEAAEECFRGEVECGEIPGWWWNHDPDAQENTEGSGLIADPLAITIPAPGPTELYPEYGEKLEELNLIPAPYEVGYDEVDTEKEKETVIIVTPGIGTQVEEETEVQVGWNPDYRVIPVINPGETYEEFKSRVEEESGLKPQKVPLPEYATDPATGPEGASYTTPAPGTAVAPGTEFNVYTNPGTAPAPDPSAGAWSPPGIASLDPPAALVGACDVFPFGVLCWAAASVAQVNVAPDCPEWEIPYTPSGEEKLQLTPCWEEIEGGLEYLRPAILFVWTLGLGFLFARATRAVGGGSGD
jgi:hypothetical protein